MLVLTLVYIYSVQVPTKTLPCLLRLIAIEISFHGAEQELPSESTCSCFVYVSLLAYNRATTLLGK